jgi:threonine dehydrogenase-like Zn-dependent dehydrogenase
MLDLAKRLPAPVPAAATAGARRVLGHERVPSWTADLPGGGTRRQSSGSTSDADAVYFPSCTGALFGAARGGIGVGPALAALCARAGLRLAVPSGADDLCCGTPWRSKGLPAGLKELRGRVLPRLWAASDGGRLPIVSDATSCTEGLTQLVEESVSLDGRYAQLKVGDAVTFALQEMLPRLPAPRPLESLALHPTCSSTRLGLDAELVQLAQSVARTVVVPTSWGCCGFAGDRGLLHPELTAAATHDEVSQLAGTDPGASRLVQPHVRAGDDPGERCAVPARGRAPRRTHQTPARRPTTRCRADRPPDGDAPRKTCTPSRERRIPMRALVYEAPEVMTLRELPTPVLGADQVLIRVAFSGICGSELSGYLGQNSLRQPPLVFGHELSGHVEALGANVPQTAALRPGAPVTANPLVSCETCEYCITGRQQLCSQRILLGAHVAGCNAELVAVSARAVLPLPTGMSLRDAAMVEPAACAVHAVEVSGATPSSQALVVGAGPIGLLILQVLALHGVRERYVADLNPARLAMAVDTGAIPVAAGPGGLGEAVRRLTGGRGVDVAIDAVGAEQTRRDCVASAAAGGRVLLVGLHTDEAALPLNAVIRSEIALTGVFAYSPANFRTALEWLALRRVGLATGVVVAPLADGPDWYAKLVAGDGAAKVLLEPASQSTETT